MRGDVVDEALQHQQHLRAAAHIRVQRDRQDRVVQLPVYPVELVLPVLFQGARADVAVAVVGVLVEHHGRQVVDVPVAAELDPVDLVAADPGRLAVQAADDALPCVRLHDLFGHIVGVGQGETQPGHPVRGAGVEQHEGGGGGRYAGGTCDRGAHLAVAVDTEPGARGAVPGDHIDLGIGELPGACQHRRGVELRVGAAVEGDAGDGHASEVRRHVGAGGADEPVRQRFQAGVGVLVKGVEVKVRYQPPQAGPTAAPTRSRTRRTRTGRDTRRVRPPGPGRRR